VSFGARYVGICKDCWGEIAIGEEVEFRRVDGAHSKGEQICHWKCPEPMLPLKYGVCEKCFMEKTAAGTCGCA
jgi:hypothetical protein